MTGTGVVHITWAVGGGFRQGYDEIQEPMREGYQEWQVTGSAPCSFHGTGILIDAIMLVCREQRQVHNKKETESRGLGRRPRCSADSRKKGQQGVYYVEAAKARSTSITPPRMVRVRARRRTSSLFDRRSPRSKVRDRRPSPRRH